MAIEATCSCGVRNEVPDAWAGRELRCTTCGGRYRVPGAPSRTAAAGRPRIHPSRRAAPPAGGGRSRVGGVLVLLLILGGLISYAGRSVLGRKPSGYRPARSEGAEERYRSAQEFFRAGSGETIDPAGDEGRVKQAIEATVAAFARADGQAFSDAFNLRRMLAQIETGGEIKEIRTRADEELVLRSLGNGLATGVRNQAGQITQWKGVTVVKVRFVPERGEADAFAFVRFEGWKAKFRFWLIKDPGGWKIYDYESLEDGLRVSILMSSIFAGGLNSERKIKALERAGAAIREAFQKIAAGEIEEGLKTVRRGRAEGVKALDSQFAAMEGVLLNLLGRHEEALQVLDRTLAREREHPAALQGRATALEALGRNEEAVKAAEEVVRMVGDDAEAYLTMGRALEALKKPAEAAAALRKGVASDAEEWECRFRLANLLLAEKKADEARPLFLEACRRAPPHEHAFAKAATALEKAEAWEALLELARDGVKRDEARARLRAGTALHRLKRYADAEMALREGLERDGEEWSDDYREQLVPVLAARGKDKEAMAIVDGMAKGSNDALYLRAYVHAAAKREAEARKELLALLKKNALSYVPVSREPLFEAARKDAEVARALQLAEEKVVYELALDQKRDDDDWEGVRELARKRVERVPDDGEAWTTLGEALRELKKYAEAEKALRTALGKLEGDGRAHAEEGLGLALAHLGRSGEALAMAEALRAREESKVRGLYVRAYALALSKQGNEAAKAALELLAAQPGYAWTLESEEAFAEVRTRPEVAQRIRQAKEPKK